MERGGVRGLDGLSANRVRAEERVLSGDTAYVAFARRVRYRLVPFVY